MPCAVGSLCEMEYNTPGPPLYTSHKCRVCGCYLHGICGLPDPLGANEMHRVCQTCVGSNSRKSPSTDHAAGAASSKRHCTEGQGTGKEQHADEMGGLKRVGNTASRNARAADSRKRTSLSQQVEALDLLKSMSGTAVAKQLGVGVSTLYGWKARAEKIREDAAASKPGAKFSKGSEFDEVERDVLELVAQARALNMPVDRNVIQSFGRKARHALANAASTDAERERYGGFTTSEGWVKKFVKHNNLKSRTLHGEAGSIDEVSISDGLKSVRRVLSKYDPE